MPDGTEEDGAPGSGAPENGAPSGGENPKPPPPPSDFDGDFDAERAKKLIENLRKEKADFQAKATRLDEIEDANKSDLEKWTQKASEFEQRAQAAEAQLLRSQVAAAKGLTPAQAARLSGGNQEELEADADELLELFGQPKATPSGSRVKPTLTPAGVGQELPDETDPAKLAARIPRR